MLLGVLLEERREIRACIADAASEVLQLGLREFVLGGFHGLHDLRLQAREVGGKCVRHEVRLPHAILAPLFEIRARADFAEKLLGLLERIAHLAHAVGIAQHLEEALLRLRIVKPVQRVAEAVLRDVHSDHPRRDALDGVRLVEDHEVVRKKVAALVVILLRDAAEAEEEQRVVHHHEVGAHELLAHALVMAARVVAAGLRRADVRLAAD